MINRLRICSFLMLLSCLISCTNAPTEIESIPPKPPLNPNGDSELALLMRDMFDDGMRMKQQIENGENPQVLTLFDDILTAEATEPEKAQSPKFKVFADAHIATLKSLKAGDAKNTKVLYQGMVESCMNCHRSMCPGPTMRIKKLFLKSTE